MSYFMKWAVIVCTLYQGFTQQIFVTDLEYTWDEARKVCRQNNGQLVTILDETKHKFVLSNIPDTR